MFGASPARCIAVTETCWSIHEVINKGDKLKLRVTIKRGRKTDHKTLLSKNYIINDAASFQLRMDTSVSLNDFTFDTTNKKEDVLLFCKFENAKEGSDTLYCANVSCTDNNDFKTFYVDSTWRVLFDHKFTTNFDITIFVDKLDKILKPFATLYPDSESADLKLIAIDGYIKLHRAVLAAYSPMFKQELCENQGEPHQSYEFVIHDARRSTLQLLKEYLYLNKVPASPLSSLMDLLLFATKYKIKELCQLCTQNLIGHANAENVYQLTQFAQSNQLAELYLNILQLIATGAIETKDIKKHIRPETVSCNEIEIKL